MKGNLPGDARVREALDHGLGHHVRRGMAQRVQVLILFFVTAFLGHVGLPS
jgi:hypothetical protein